ncbi:hypothetical protein RJ641_000733 [Dillenia turbinata]|uniref:At4g15545-like C-terminal domain-containing protein n=1 Tax=Dillenia turbinata TaxID=194707 RepID=A0AAN8W8Q5_9MAGN
MAIASRVSKLESETQRLRQKMYEKDRVIVELEEKVSHLQCLSNEAKSQLKVVLDENMKLSKERDSLAANVKKLSRDLGKLETFKRQLMLSLSDDGSSQTETIDIRTCDQSVPKAYPSEDERSNGYASQNSSSGPVGSGSSTEASKYTGLRFSIAPYVTPRLTPTGTPKAISSTGLPRGYSTAGSCQRSSGHTSPMKHQYDGRGSLSSWYPSSQQSSAANSPPRTRSLPGRTPRIDGKEFFRQARSRLSYEQFSAFLANIKELNAQTQTREETLKKAEEIFGIDNKDLYLSFQGLLNRNSQ